MLQAVRDEVLGCRTIQYWTRQSLMLCEAETSSQIFTEEVLVTWNQIQLELTILRPQHRQVLQADLGYPHLLLRLAWVLQSRELVDYLLSVLAYLLAWAAILDLNSSVALLRVLVVVIVGGGLLVVWRRGTVSADHVPCAVVEMCCHWILTSAVKLMKGTQPLCCLEGTEVLKELLQQNKCGI